MDTAKYNKCITLINNAVIFALCCKELGGFMKRRTIILLIVAAIMCCMLTACETGPSSNSVDSSAISSASFKAIDGKETLVYSTETRVVYYMFSTSESKGYKGYGYSYFAPYISENGKFCRYINDEIVEIVEETD